MLTLVVAFNALFLILALYEDDNKKSIILCAIAAFLGMGAFRISLDATNYQFAYLPLSFVIISIIWAIYKIYLIFVENNKKDWGTEVDGLGIE